MTIDEEEGRARKGGTDKDREIGGRRQRNEEKTERARGNREQI